MNENNKLNAAFGDSKAAFILSDLLSNEKVLRRKVTNYVSQFNHRLNCLYDISDTHVSIGLARILWVKSKTDCLRFPENMRSFILNVVSSGYKKFLRNLNAQKPKRKRTKI